MGISVQGRYDVTQQRLLRANRGIQPIVLESSCGKLPLNKVTNNHEKLSWGSWSPMNTCQKMSKTSPNYPGYIWIYLDITWYNLGDLVGWLGDLTPADLRNRPSGITTQLIPALIRLRLWRGTSKRPDPYWWPWRLAVQTSQIWTFGKD